MRMPLDPEENIEKVNVLIWATKAYSETEFSIRVIVDPWYIVHNGGLTFSKNWLLQAALANDSDKRIDKESAENTDLDTSKKGDNADDETGKQLVLYRDATHEVEVTQAAPMESEDTESPVCYFTNFPSSFSLQRLTSTSIPFISHGLKLPQPQSCKAIHPFSTPQENEKPTYTNLYSQVICVSCTYSLDQAMVHYKPY